MDLLLTTAQRLVVFVADMGIQMTPGQSPAVTPAGDGAQVAAQVAYGAPQPAPGFFEGGNWMLLVVWGAVFVGMYFLMFRPQRKREKAMREMQSAIKSGDNIITSGGLFGRVADIGTDSLVIEFGTGGRSVKIPVLKSDVVGIREPVLTPPPKVD